MFIWHKLLRRNRILPSG